MDNIIDLYIKLGQTVHRDYLNGDQVQDQYAEVSKEIVQAEKALYMEEKDQIPGPEEHICPSCGASYEEGYNFCTSCGENLQEFYQGYKECQLCFSLIPNEDWFCQACGALNKDGGRASSDEEE